MPSPNFYRRTLLFKALHEKHHGFYHLICDRQQIITYRIEKRNQNFKSRTPKQRNKEAKIRRVVAINEKFACPPTKSPLSVSFSYFPCETVG